MLIKLIREAFAADPVVVDQRAAAKPFDVPQPPPHLALACATCGGACCMRGGDEAYLSVETIQRYRRANPAATPAEILKAYRSHLDTRTYVGSCIFHGAQGCTLPRALRSDSCHEFRCGELVEIERATDGRRLSMFFVAIDDSLQLVRTSSTVQ